MRDLVGHDHRTSAFLVYLALTAGVRGRHIAPQPRPARGTDRAVQAQCAGRGAPSGRTAICCASPRRGATDVPRYELADPLAPSTSSAGSADRPPSCASAARVRSWCRPDPGSRRTSRKDRCRRASGSERRARSSRAIIASMSSTAKLIMNDAGRGAHMVARISENAAQDTFGRMAWSIEGQCRSAPRTSHPGREPRDTIAQGPWDPCS